MLKRSLNRKGFPLLILSVVFIGSCVSAPEEEPLVMDALMPPVEEKVVVTEVKKTLPVIPLYVQGRVMEVEVEQGVQKYLYIKFNDEIVPGPIPAGDWGVSEARLINMPRSYSLSSGMAGEIYSDTQFSEKAGDFVLLEQFADIYKARIDGLNYIIDRTSMVQIQIR